MYYLICSHYILKADIQMYFSDIYSIPDIVFPKLTILFYFLV